MFGFFVVSIQPRKQRNIESSSIELNKKGKKKKHIPKENINNNMKINENSNIFFEYSTSVSN